MTKTEFLEELNQRLIVLTEEERRDILDEYEQHIDMKVPTGMTEEEVIASFGRISDLAADILEAYHVRPDFVNEERDRKHGGRIFGFWKTKQERMDRGEAAGAGEEEKSGLHIFWEECGKLWEAVMRGCRKGWEGFEKACGRAGRACRRGFQRAGELLEKWAGRLAALCRKPFRKREEEETSLLSEPVGQADETRSREQKQRRRKEGMGIGRAMGNLCRAVWKGCLWCLRWIWNLSWMGAGLMIGFVACMVLYCMGVLTVLLVLGYPVTGVTIGCLGLTLCTVSVTAFCFTLVRIRKKPGSQKHGKKERQEKEEQQEEAVDAAVSDREEEEMIHA